MLQIFTDAGVTLSLRKYVFYSNEIDYLGHLIKLEFFEVANYTAEAI